MTSQKFSYTRRLLRTISFSLIAVILLQACATRHVFYTSSVVPAAEGSVKVKKDNNNNYTIDLEVNNLADPQRLDPAKAMYIVWMETDQNGQKNIGQLKTGSSLLSSKLKSSLKTVSSFSPKGFFITAEDQAEVAYPSGQEILRSN